MNTPPPRPTRASTFRVPHDVVYRSFVSETVVLHLGSGKYYGLNQTAGRTLELLKPGVTVQQASAELAREYGRPLAEVEQDCLELCTRLTARGLLELT